MTPVFALVGAGKSYPGKVALAPTDLTIAPGERVALLGPSGSGKSTLLNLLGAVLLPDSGRVLIAGKPTATLRPGRERARLVGMMHQQFDLVDSLPVVHNVLAGCLGEWGLFRSALSLVVPQEAGRAREALARVGIADKYADRTSRLSGGEQQRVALARLIVQQPQAILADEPVSSLDPARAEDLVAMLSQVAAAGGQTLVASLHMVPLALKYFSRIVALREGRVYFDRPVQQVRPADLDELYALREGA